MESVRLQAFALFVFFGSTWVLYGCLWLHERVSCGTASSQRGQDADAPLSTAHAPAAPLGHSKKVLSEPLSLTLSSVRALSRELSRLGAMVGFAYLCEHHPPFPHGKKEHDMDMFWSAALVLLVLSLLNVRKSKGGDVLNREQTEEWKGWMQFMFLQYHYFSAHETYNTIRVFITAYVWMTGFGNFSFFYLKADYGAVRMLQMLWRLNFLVLFLCMAMGNHYILYYICPLHTFYFLVVYVIMRLFSSANYSKNGMRCKLAVAALVISWVWDWDFQTFEKIFWFLDRKKVIGASWGTMWEWYFRTSLDHWSTFLGMIFALNYPATSLWVKKVEALPRLRQWAIKGSAAAVLLAASTVWAVKILPMSKLDYNKHNAYFGVVGPVLTYIFLRNLTPLMRTRYLEPLHSLGKITLETYLMQHHIWLTSNAKTLLVVVPGCPKLNLVVVTISYVLVSRELYRLTMSLRGMCLPDDLKTCVMNLTGILFTLLAALIAAAALQSARMGLAGCIYAVAVVGFALAVLVHLLLRGREISGGAGGTGSMAMASTGTCPSGSLSSSGRTAGYDGRLLRALHVMPVFAAVVAAAAIASLYAPSVTRPAGEASQIGDHDACVEAANRGMWKVDSGGCTDPDQAGAYCYSHTWKWVGVPDQCHLQYMTPAEVKGVLGGRHVLIVGDSVQRFVYHALLRSIGETTPWEHGSNVEKHQDSSWASSDASTTRISFLWAPRAADRVRRVEKFYDTVNDSSGAPDLLMIGGGLWDALETHGNVQEYAEGIEELKRVLEGIPGQGHSPPTKIPIKIWVTMTEAVAERLNSEEKRQWLTAPVLDSFRGVVKSSGFMEDVDAVVDGLSLTTGQLRESYDGVHYSDNTYNAFAQVTANLLKHFGWVDDSQARPSTDKRIVGMGNVHLGLMVVLLATIMVVTRDAFHGIPRLALALLGGGEYASKSMGWEEVYGDLLRKIGKHPDGPSVTASIGAAGDWENKGGNVSGAVAVDEAREGLLVQEQGASGPLKLTHRTHPPVLTEAKREF